MRTRPPDGLLSLALTLGFVALGGCARDVIVADENGGAAAGGPDGGGLAGSGGAAPATGGGIDDGGDDGDGSDGDSVTTVGTTTTAGSASTGGGSLCEGVRLFDEPVNGCGLASCCTEMALCASEDGSGCVSSGGTIDTGSTQGELLLDCLRNAGCFTNADSPICDSGVILAGGQPNVAEVAACLGEACCEEFNDCTDGDGDPGRCVDCLDGGGGPLCDEAIACARAECEFRF